MKKFFYSILIFAAGIVAASSCEPAQQIAPLASSLSVDKAEVSLNAKSGSAVVKVTADGDWIAVAGGWVSVTPKSGGSGTTEVTISAADNVNEYNEVMGPRKEVLYFFGDGEEAGMASVSVAQKGENGLNSERSYSKVTKIEDLDTEKAFLLVANISGKLQAAAAVPGTPGDGRYYYWNSLVEVEEANGVIVRPNGNQGFKFVPVEEGKYAIQEPGGGYLYQHNGYATSFYIAAALTGDPEDADKWSVSFNEAGNVVLTNTTCGDGNTVMQYLNGSYTEFASYADYPAADCVVLDLYQDAAAATDEILKADDIAVVASATEVTIPVTANKEWSVRNHDTWIKTFAKNEEGNGIVVTFDPNTSTTDVRTATFLIIGQTTNLEVTLTQGKVAASVADLVAQITSTSSGSPSLFEATLTNAVVSYTNGNTVYIEDASGAVKYFKSGHGMTAGNTITGKVSGKAYIRNGVPQITELTLENEAGTGGTIPLTEITLANLLNNYDANISRRVIIKGVTVIDAIGTGDRNGKVKQGDKELAIYAEISGTTIAQDATGDLIAFPSKYNATRQLSVWTAADLSAATSN